MKYYFFLLLAFFFILIFSFTTSPLYVCEGTDSAIFKTIGYGLLQGKIPYRDLFDQKGPLLWLIQACGLWINFKLGIFILQIVSVSFTLFLWYKLANLFIQQPLHSFYFVVLMLFPFMIFSHGGNQCEEWMLPFLSLSYYFAIKYLLFGQTKIYRIPYSLIWGLCFGFVFYIRVNDAFAQCGGIIFGVFLYMIVKKKYKEILPLVFLCFSGFIIVSIPILSYYIYNDAVDDLVYGMFTFSMQYSGGFHGFFVRLFSLEKIEYASLLVLFLTLYSYKYYKKDLVYVILPTVLLTYFSLGPMMDSRYPAISTLPLYVICFSLVIMNIGRFKMNYVVILIILLFPLIESSRYPLDEPIKLLTKDRAIYRNFYNETDRLLNNIPDNERNSVWNYDLGYDTVNGVCSDPHASFTSIFFHDGITQCNKVILKDQAKIDPKLKEDDCLLFKKMTPKWIVSTCKFAVKDKKLNSNFDYYLYDKTNSSICNIFLYKRK